MHDGNRTVISLGGSIFIPDQIDVGFLREFKRLIEERIASGETFFIFVGGGKICRRYQQAGRELGAERQEDGDWIGIHVTRLNAEFMRVIFGQYAHASIVIDPHQALESDKPLIFGAGGKPGWSTDYDAVVMAKTLGAKRVINLSNTSHVYDKDPRKFADAKPLTALTWEEYRKLIPTEWGPGLNSPFDPVASKEAQEGGLEVVIMDGIKLDEVRKCLDGEPFDGTTIKG